VPVVVVAVGVAVKMKYVLDCPVCKKEVYSSLGNGCKMCGMVLDNTQSFCCKICMRKYNTINKGKDGGARWIRK
jgi:transposase-like protein